MATATVVAGFETVADLAGLVNLADVQRTRR